VGNFRSFDQPDRPHLVRPGGGLSSELYKLRRDLSRWSDSVSTAARTDLYVATTGDDDNPGTDSERPLLTLAAAIQKVPPVVDHEVVIHFASGDYEWGPTVGPFLLRRPLVIIGDGAGQVGDDGFTVLQATKAADAGSGLRVVVDPDGGLVVNAYSGKTIEILTGAAAGDRRTIHSNTATNIVPSAAFTAAVSASDQFRIVEPAVEFKMPPAPEALGGGPPQLVGCGSPSASDRWAGMASEGEKPSSVVLANLAIGDDVADLGATFKVCNSMLYCYGVELRSRGSFGLFTVDDHSELFSGIDTTAVWTWLAPYPSSANLPFQLGLSASKGAWLGWGLAGGVGVQQIHALQKFTGFLTAPRVQAVSQFKQANWLLLGGRIAGNESVNQNGFLIFDQRCLIRMHGFDALIPIRVEVAGSDPRSFAIMSAGMSIVQIESAEIVITGNGMALHAGSWHGSATAEGLAGAFSLARAGRGLTLSAPRVAIGATRGGRVHYDNAPTLSVVPSVAELAVWQGPTSAAPVATSTFAALGDGASIVNTTTPGDGTCIMRVT
jgi:hypothetical protein